MAWPAAGSGVVELALRKTSARETGWRIEPHPRGKPARTAWRMLAVADGRALVLFTPTTGGRTRSGSMPPRGSACRSAATRVYGRGGTAMLLHALSLVLPREGKPPVAAAAPPPPGFPALPDELLDAAA